MKFKQYNFINFLKHDIKNGILGEWKKFVVVIVATLFLCARLFLLHKNILANPNWLLLKPVELQLCFGDYIFYIFKGMNIFNSTDIDFKINIIWIVINGYIAFITSHYPFRDLEGYGQLMLIRSQKRSTWWISKCIWNMLTVITFYFTTYFTIFIFSIFTGNLSIIPQTRIQMSFSESNVGMLNPKTVIIIMFILPILVSISMCILQMLVSLIINPLISMVVTLAILSFSIFYCSNYMIGNHIMLMRNELFIPNFGVGTTEGIVLSLLIIVVSTLVGLIIIKKYDMVSK